MTRPLTATISSDADVIDSDLVAYWSRLDLSGAPFVHPDDRPFFEKHRPRDLKHPILDAANYARDVTAKDPKFTHLSLLPVPYIGDLKRADIFVLLLNPGFSEAEYAVEADAAVSAMLRRTLQQDVSHGYPLWYLAPHFSQHPGHQYWVRRLKGIGSHDELSRRIAVIERFPYHSKKFGHAKIARNLPSSLIAARYVQKILNPRVIAKEVLLIVARGASAFGLSQNHQASNLIVYGPGETASAWLTPGSRGGKAILEWIAAHPR